MHVFYDSVLCLTKIHDHSEANKKWKSQIQDVQQTYEYTELFELEWNIFQGLTTLQILQKIQDKLEACQTSPEKFEDRIIFMPMFNDIDWTKTHSKECLSNSEEVSGHWSFLAPGEEDKWYGTHKCNLEESGI